MTEKIEIKLKKCCLTCENIAPDGIYGMSLHPNREISCQHMPVCKKYLQEMAAGENEGFDMVENKKRIAIRNQSGILHVEVEREISLRDVMYGRGEDKLPSFTRPRLEFHKRKSGNLMVTLFDQTNVFPSNMYLFIVDGDEIKAYVGRVDSDEEEDNSFLTCTV